MAFLLFAALSSFRTRGSVAAGALRAPAVRMAGAGAPAASELTIVMNGLPGAMGVEVAEACLRRGMRLAPFGLTGPSRAGSSVEVSGPDGRKQTVRLVPGPVGSDAGGECEAVGLELERMRAEGRAVVCIDYTHPSAVNANAAWYARHKLPFVMGTTGGDRAALEATIVATPGLFAVVAPNMAKQIVALQAGLAKMAADYPGAFEGYALRVTESHQASKADTSGTAKAISRSLATLAAIPQDGALPQWSDASIVRIRDQPSQLSGAPVDAGAYGRLNPVPESALAGHAYHTYSLVAPDGSVEFQWRHNVNGRRVYAEGTADAALFLAERAGSGATKRMYSMIDVLESGALL